MTTVELVTFKERKGRPAKLTLTCPFYLLSRARLFVTPWTVAHQPPMYMGCSRQRYWSVLPFPSLGDLPDPGIEPVEIKS